MMLNSFSKQIAESDARLDALQKALREETAHNRDLRRSFVAYQSSDHNDALLWRKVNSRVRWLTAELADEHRKIVSGKRAYEIRIDKLTEAGFSYEESSKILTPFDPKPYLDLIAAYEIELSILQAWLDIGHHEASGLTGTILEGWTRATDRQYPPYTIDNSQTHRVEETNKININRLLL